MEDIAKSAFRESHVSMSSLTGSLGRVSLVFHSNAIPSSSRQQRSCRRLSCNCALPAISNSAPPAHILDERVPIASEKAPSEGSKGDSHLGFEHSNNEAGPVSVGYGFQERTGLQSLLSVVVALALTIGIQGAPSSRDTFEDVPQTLSGERSNWLVFFEFDCGSELLIRILL